MSKENRVSDERLTLIAAGIADRLGLGVSGAPDLDRDIASAITELLSLRSKPVAGVEVNKQGWRHIDGDAMSGDRILLLWSPFEGIKEHVELGWYSNRLGQWVNTYGQPFSGEPDRWAPLLPFSTLSLPAQEPEEDEGSRQAAVDIADAVMKWMVKHDLLDPEHEYFDHDIIEVLNDLAPVEEARILYRHQKRGTVYELIGIGKMQAEGWHASAPGFAFHVPVPVDMSEVAVYRSVDNPDEIWVRPRGEFEDGRFAALKEA